MECYVYWLHLPEHTDIFSQGYVGVSIEPEKRFIQHLSDARTLKHCNEHLRRAVEKYGESIYFSILQLYDSAYEYFDPKFVPQLVVMMADYMDKSSRSLDQEITLVAFLTTLMIEAVFKE